MENIFQKDKKVFIRTVTYHHVGEVEGVVGDFVLLKNASWVADSGRFHVALRDGKLSEVEPMPGVVAVNTKAIVDVAEWNHELPTAAI